jgi:electron transport complex protein RnfA
MANHGEAQVVSKHEILVRENLLGISTDQIRLLKKEDSDIRIPVESLKSAGPEKTLLTTAETLDSRGEYIVDIASLQKNWVAEPSTSVILMSTILGAALVNNFVFTRYLGLCVFFGVSRKKVTAIGMGVTFTLVAILSGLLSWGVNNFVLSPLKLNFLQIIAFIGIIAFLVQALDTILKKIRPVLHSQFGIYLVLITTNCIILAVPLLNATSHANFLEAFALSAGSGLGFALALFLMSCAREAVDVAPVPSIFKGLPIAFILAGLFALSFLGFSGLKLF